MISGHWFNKKNRGSNRIFTNLLLAHPMNIITEFEENPCIGLRDEVEEVKKFMTATTTMTTTDTG